MERRAEAKKLLSTFALGDMALCYVQGVETGSVGMRILPCRMVALAKTKDCGVEPLVQLKLVGDDYAGGFGSGHTLRDSASVRALEYDRQEVEEDERELRVDTYLKDARGYTCVHRLNYRKGAEYLSVSTSFRNESGAPATLELLSSFALGELSFFREDDGSGTLEMYKMLSHWSAEGRLVHESVEHAHLEPSWARFGAFYDRWGQVGSMPVRRYFPFAAVEDREFGVIWAAELTCGASWQLEAGRGDWGFSLSGGLADRELGHWLKTVQPGETFDAPEAVLTVTAGGVEDACERLIGYTEDRLDVPESEKSLPPLFNEYCTTWGTPQEDSVCRIADAVERLKLAYFVIDAGWYAEIPGRWAQHTGNWQVSPFLFSRGLEDTLNHIRSRGMLPGVWFEFEAVGRECCRFTQAEWLLKRDGIPLTVGDRRFWDFRMPEVRDYLRQRVIEFLRRYDFKYIKVDYNDTLGIGVDGAESLGEGLREQIEAVRDFFREIHSELPDVVIELCSSGGHRLVPSFLTLASMASFSDAHECVEIPIVAANMHRMIPPRQSQIWSVLHTEHSEAQLYYKLTAGLLGRLCLSGEVLDLSAEQWKVVERCVAFYRRVAPVIARGRSRRYGPELAEWRHPKGWQALVRVNADAALVVVHTFAEAPGTVRVPVPEGYAVDDVCARTGVQWAQCGRHLILTGLSDMDGLGVLLRRAN